MVTSISGRPAEAAPGRPAAKSASSRWFAARCRHGGGETRAAGTAEKSCSTHRSSHGRPTTRTSYAAPPPLRGGSFSAAAAGAAASDAAAVAPAAEAASGAAAAPEGAKRARAATNVCRHHGDIIFFTQLVGCFRGEILASTVCTARQNSITGAALAKTVILALYLVNKRQARTLILTVFLIGQKMFEPYENTAQSISSCQDNVLFAPAVQA